MPVNTVNVTGTLRLPSGLPAALATIRFTLSNPALLGVTVVVPQNVRATTDVNGVFNVSLLPNLKFAYYTVTVYRSTGVVILETVAVIPAFDCQFSQVIQVRPSTNASASIVALSELQAAQAGIEAARLQIIATASSASSVSTAALVELQSAVDTYETLMANTQSSLVGLVDTAIGTSLDLVTAYQLST